MYYNSTPYFYILNLQGDVIRMVDGVGNIVASYEYDPYGKVISATGWLAEVNPLRYRGYYYDTETQLYHLWSRYYDPQTGRFISADAYASTGQGALGYNMFAYCYGNPINYCDHTGTFAIEISVFGIAILSVVIVVGCAVAAKLLADVVSVLWDAVDTLFYNPFPVQETVEFSDEAQIEFYDPHTKNKSEKNRNKHEYGDSRRQRDQGGEKKKQKKDWVPNRNKRGGNRFDQRFISIY